eukprot:TRINITY_DN327_c0_g1_i1.p1 TRINITY_DN327_c0_g1~~TRINITY_DN327_c0_g1_i1.p1  ORF type:complete len:237 (-),score=123.87 TRINITY_DN327_c0_g1_i1:91-801(-)
MAYGKLTHGEEGTTDFRIFITRDNQVISSWHDIPLHFDTERKIFNYVLEIPKGTNAKLEISAQKPETSDPIKQDVKNGKLRFVANVNGNTGYPWNYGAFPQTYEDPLLIDEDTGAGGDKDPLDVCDISSIVSPSGSVRQVKVLGALALIDEGETDWKIICIDVNDPQADQINDIGDIERVRPGYLENTHNWFRDYKIPDGKPANVFAFNGEFKNREFALKTVEKYHLIWKNKFARL